MIRLCKELTLTGVFLCQRNEETVKEVASLYINGDKDLGLSPHLVPIFLDQRGKALKYAHGSKVLDRISKRDTKKAALSEKDKI